MAGKLPALGPTARSTGVIAIAAGIGLLAAPALAYVLPADVIVSSVVSRRAGLGISSLVVEGRHTANGQAAPLWAAVKAGRAWRVQTKRDGNTKVNLLVGDRRWKFVLGGAAGTPTRVRDDLMLRFVLPKSKDGGGKRGIAFLKAHKVDTDVVSFGRFDGRVAFVIGAKPWESTKPQLWVDKELRVPLRFVHVDGANVVHEQRLTGWGTEVVDQWFPRVIERLENGKAVERIEVFGVEPNADVDRDLLAPPS